MPELFSTWPVLDLSNRKRFPCLHSLIYKHERVGRIRDSYANPKRSRILPTPLVFISGCTNRGKKFSIAFINNFPEKNAKLFVMAFIKREILTSRKVLYTTSCTRNMFFFLQKRCYSKYGFFSLKMSA